MRKKNLMKGISTVLVALALCVGIPGVANAAPVEDAAFYETEMVQVGAPKATSIKIKNTTLSGTRTTQWTISFPAVPKGYRLYFNVYEGNDPKKSESGSWYKSYNKEYFYSYDYAEEGDTELTLYASYTPGTKNVVAYLCDYDGYKASSGVSQADFYSPASNKLSIKVSAVAYVYPTVKSNSIIMSFGASKYPTGYEIYRKEGGKFKKIAKVASDTYTDKGLAARTTYTYKVRPYYYNSETKKTAYGDYTQFERTTAGSPLNLKIALSGKKNVKLSWNKVAGAVKYEVYRKNGDLYSDESYSDTVSKGTHNNYDSYRLIATVSKNKKAYTDKKTTAGQSYSYMVCAVLDGKQKVTVYESKSITLQFGSPSRKASYYNASGARTVEWNKVYGADGYLVERKDSATGEWVVDRKLSKNTTKITISAPTPKKTQYGWETPSKEYRIWATKGTARSSSSISVTVDRPTLGVVSNVSAKKVANGIRVSWSPVKGAAYYRVYRVNADARVKSKDINGYITDYNFASSSSDYISGYQVSEYVGVVTPQVYKDYPYASDNETHYYQNYSYTRSQFTTTSMLDYAGDICGYDGATKEAFYNYSGPESGVAYQYYVVAYAAEQQGTRNVWAYNTTTHSSSYIQVPDFGSDWNDSYSYSKTLGCKKLGEATYTSIKAPGKAKIKSVKSAKAKQAVITFGKVKKATSYKIYRSTKKKGTYVCVGTTNKTKYTDTGLTSGQTYYYKVVAVAANEVGADINGSASAVKSVKVK